MGRYDFLQVDSRCFPLPSDKVNQVHDEMIALHEEERAYTYTEVVSLENPMNARHRLVQVERNNPFFVEST